MSQPCPILLTSIEHVADHQVDALRRTRLLANHLLFDVFLTVVEEPVTLDARQIPYRILDGRIRIHEARRRGLRHIPAVLTVPGLNETEILIQMMRVPLESYEAEPEESAETDQEESPPSPPD